MAGVRSLLAETGLRIDPAYAGEVRRILDSPGLRRRYLRRNGPDLDTFAELLWSRGITGERIDIHGVLELLDSLRLGEKAAKSRGRRRCTRKDLAGIELEAERAKNARNKKFICQECGKSRCNGAVSTCDVICGRCYRESGAIVFLTRVEMTFTEVMNQTAAAECVPF